MEQRDTRPPGYTGYRILTSLDLPGPGEESLSSCSAGNGNDTETSSTNGVGQRPSITAIVPNTYCRKDVKRDFQGGGSGANDGVNRYNSLDFDEENEGEIQGRLSRTVLFLLIALAVAAVVSISIASFGSRCRGRFTDWCEKQDRRTGIDVIDLLRRGEFGAMKSTILQPYVIWAVNAGVGGLTVAAFFFISVCRRKIGTRRMKGITETIQRECWAFLWRIGLIGCAIGIIVFLGIGFGLDWRTAACYAVGFIVSALAQSIGVRIAVMSAVRTSCAACYFPAAALNVAFRGAVSISLTNVSLGLISIGAMYIITRDAEALIGIIAGATTVSILLRISTAIYAKGSDMGADLPSFAQGVIPRNDPRNPAVLADLVGDGLQAVSGLGADLFESYVGSIIATVLLSRGLPFFEEDAFALCVTQHLHIDALCRASSAKPQFFARALCLNEDVRNGYPSLSVWASNSVFAALPLLLALSGLLISILVTFYVREPKIEQHATEETITNKLLNSLRINAVVSTILLAGVAAVLCWVLFGSSSRFGRVRGFGREDARVPTFLLKNGLAGCPSPMDLAAAADDPAAIYELLLSNGELVSGSYEPVGLTGKGQYSVSQIAPRLFACIGIGLILGIWFGVATEFWTSKSYSPTRSVALRARYGAPLGLIHCLGISGLSTVLSVIFVVVVIIGSARLYGGYGVALSSVAVMATLGLAQGFEVLAGICDIGDGIAEVAELSSKVRTTTLALDSLGDTTGAIGKGFSNGAGILAAYSIYLLFTMKLISSLQINGVGGPSLLLGSLTEAARLHITELQQFPPVPPDAYTVAGILFGILLVVWFSSMITLAISGAGQHLITEVRRYFSLKRGSTGSSSSEDMEEAKGRWKRYTRIATREGLLGSVLPVTVTIASPVLIGFLFGSATLHSFLAALIGAGYIVGIYYSNAGSSFDNAKKVVRSHHRPSRAWAEAVLAGDLLGDCLKDGIGVNMPMLIKAAVVISILILSTLSIDRGKIWIGSIILGVVLLFGVAFAIWKQAYDSKHRLHLQDDVASATRERHRHSVARWVSKNSQPENFPSLQGEAGSSGEIHSSPFFEPRPAGATNLKINPTARRCKTMPLPRTTSSTLQAQAPQPP